MSDATTHLGLPYLLAAQAQKHVTHNEAIRLLDGLVQMSVLSRALATPPASPQIFDVGGMTVGVLICFDAEFPEHMRAVARRGAWLVAVPRALPLEGSGDFAAGKVMPVRAFESQIFVAYADHAGFDGRFRYAGGSCVAAPDGSELARAGREPTLLVTDLNDGAYDASRKAKP